MNTITHQYSGSDWIIGSLKIQPSPLGIAVADILGLVYYGIYHLEGCHLEKVNWTHPDYIRVQLNRGMDLASYDFNELTKLVALAHDLCIRVQVSGHGMNALRLTFTPRDRNADSMMRRHPTMEEALAAVRSTYQSVPVASCSPSVQ
jgi:hypothetical protein